MDNIVLTENGLALRDKLNAGQTTAAFTRFCTSSAEYDQSELGTLTELKDSKLESAVTNLEILEDHTMVVSGAVDNKSLQEGYYITLIGLYAKETDGEEILFAVSKVSSPMYMPEKSGALSGMSIRFSIKIENADSVTVTVDPTTAATLGDLNALKKEVLTPAFEDYEADEAPEIPDLDESLKQIKSGNTMRVILQNTKAALKGLLNLVNAKVNQKDYDAAVSKLNGDIAKKANSNHTHDLNAMINTLSTASGTPSDADYYVSQYAGGGSQNTTYYRRTMRALWAYIKGKADSVYASKSINNSSSSALTVTSKSNLGSCNIGLSRTGNSGILRMQFRISDASKSAQAKCTLPNGLASYSQGSVPVTVYGKSGVNIMLLAFWASGKTLQLDIYPMIGSSTGASSADNFINIPLVFS